MSLFRPPQLLLVCLFLTSPLPAQCSQDHRSDKKAGILVSDFTITGTHSLSSGEIKGIEAELAGSCFDEDSDEMGQRVRALFQDRGYFMVEVKGVRLKAADPLGVPKPVTMEAEVTEGARYKVGEITFARYRAFAADRLRQEFPMKTGDWFERGKVASGLEGLRKLYGGNGFLDATFIPATEVGSNGTIHLTVDFEEGPLYHLQKVDILAKKELVSKLRPRWKLDEGSVYDDSYIDKYIEENRDLLPEGFDRRQIQVVQNCPEALVEVKLLIDPVEAASSSPSKPVPCEKKEDPPK
jgi:outer membrane protein assembly factor BamA